MTDFILCPVQTYDDTGYEGYPPLWDEDKFNDLMNEAIKQTPNSELKTWLLENNMWIRVYPFNNYTIDGFAYEVHTLYDGKWSSYGSNSLFSSGHLVPTYKTEDEAMRAAIEKCKLRLKNGTKY